MEGLGRAPARTEADLRAALAELARRAPSADDVLSAVREAGSRRQRRSARLPGQQWPAGPGRVRTRRLGWRQLAVGAAAAGLLAGWLIAPPLTGTGAGLVSAPGAPSISVPAVIIVAVIALAVAAISSFVPAIRAARTSTVSALADAPRVPSRRPLVIAVSARLPVPLLLALRQLSRWPRRALLNTASITTTVTGIVAILASRAHTPIANLTISNLKLDRFNELTAIITVMLIILAAVNTTFIAWATAADGRFSSALERALGATAGQVTVGLSMTALLPALPGAIIGIPLGIAVYHLLASGTPLAVPPAWQLVGVFLATLLAVTVLTAIPSRLGARRSPAQVLQTG